MTPAVLLSNWMIFVLLLLPLSLMGCHAFSTSQSQPRARQQHKSHLFSFHSDPHPQHSPYSQNYEPPYSSSSSSSQQSLRCLEQFTFADNGVCLTPATFVSQTPARTRTFTMRNVPGTGDCMFQAVMLASLTSMGLGGNDALLNVVATEIRSVVAHVLYEGFGSNQNGRPAALYVDAKNPCVPVGTLLRSAAHQEGMSPQTYLDKLQTNGSDGGLHGGGPELTVLSNILRRPISVYELLLEENNNNSNTNTNNNNNNNNAQPPSNTNDESCYITCRGVFGDPIFRDPCAKIPNSAVLLPGLQPGAYSWHLHILVVDVLSTGEKHACVLLPQDDLQ